MIERIIILSVFKPYSSIIYPNELSGEKDLKTLNLSDIENEFMILIRLNLYCIGYTVKSQRFR